MRIALPAKLAPFPPHEIAQASQILRAEAVQCKREAHVAGLLGFGEDQARIERKALTLYRLSLEALSASYLRATS